jgi:hypothetical protein
MIKWLMRNNPALLGDIVEERASGRSRAWYWRQIVVAVARSIGSSVRHHPVLMLRALAAALVSYTLVAAAIAVAEGYVYGRYLGWMWLEPGALLILIPVAVIPAFFAGWLVPRTHRACAEAAILVLVFSLAVLSSNDIRFRAAATVSLLAGAFVAFRQDARRSTQEGTR